MLARVRNIKIKHNIFISVFFRTRRYVRPVNLHYNLYELRNYAERDVKIIKKTHVRIKKLEVCGRMQSTTLNSGVLLNGFLNNNIFLTCIKKKKKKIRL